MTTEEKIKIIAQILRHLTFLAENSMRNAPGTNELTKIRALQKELETG